MWPLLLKVLSHTLHEKLFAKWIICMCIGKYSVEKFLSQVLHWTLLIFLPSSCMLLECCIKFSLWLNTFTQRVHAIFFPFKPWVCSWYSWPFLVVSSFWQNLHGKVSMFFSQFHVYSCYEWLINVFFWMIFSHTLNSMYFKLAFVFKQSVAKYAWTLLMFIESRTTKSQMWGLEITFCWERKWKVANLTFWSFCTSCRNMQGPWVQISTTMSAIKVLHVKFKLEVILVDF